MSTTSADLPVPWTPVPPPTPGAVYDVGGAVAMYWPDVHPCGPLRAESWIVFTPDGATHWDARLRTGARFLGMMPGCVAGDGDARG